MSVKIEFTDQELQVLNAALGEVPFRLAAPLVASINRQILAQREAAAADEPIELNGVDLEGDELDAPPPPPAA